MKKEQHRQCTFDLITKNIGKGVKNSLKRDTVVNQNNQVDFFFWIEDRSRKRLLNATRNVLEKHVHQKHLRIKHVPN